MSGNPEPHGPVPRSEIASSHRTSLAAQSREIIDFILADPSPGLAGIQLRLRDCVAAHPGLPDKALLAHMIETCRQANSRTRQAERI